MSVKRARLLAARGGNCCRAPIASAACAIGAAWQAKYHRLAALALVGGTGLATSITFLWLSAPDLALTQLMVETVTTVLILLGLRWLPPRLPPPAPASSPSWGSRRPS